jgi:hypothetical protein
MNMGKKGKGGVREIKTNITFHTQNNVYAVKK